jgi:hypothetical protein
MLADVWGAVGGVGSLVAGVAAVVAIWYARATVRESRDARSESHTYHQQDLSQAQAATDATVAELRTAAEASMSVVREAERARRDAVRDRRRQRLVLLHELAEEVYWNAHNGNTAGWMWARNRLRVAMVGIQPGDA